MTVPTSDFSFDHFRGADIVIDGGGEQALHLLLRRAAVDVLNLVLRQLGVRGCNWGPAHGKLVSGEDFQNGLHGPGADRQQSNCAHHDDQHSHPAQIDARASIALNAHVGDHGRQSVVGRSIALHAGISAIR